MGIIQQNHNSSLFEKEFFHSKQTYVHPTSIIGPNVKLGQGVKIGPSSIIVGNVIIEDGTRIYPNVIIGFPAQVHNAKNMLGTIFIEKNCEIREFVTIHAPKSNDGVTRIGNNCYIMNYCHISHDSILENNVTLTNCVNLGGHTYVEKHANLMAGAAIHQFCRIGRYTALAPFSAIRQDLPPFCLFDGKPARFMGLNVVGLKRAGFTPSNLSALKQVTKLFYHEKKSIDDIEKEISQQTWGQDHNVQTFITFTKKSKRGISRNNLLDVR